jgi:hypothetical protein
MQMKPIMESRRAYIAEEEPRVRNIDKAIEFLDSLNIDYEKRSNTKLVVRSPDRVKLQRDIEPALAEMGYEWEPNAPSAGFGRFALRARNLGSVYMLLKPTGRRAAGAGADYEKDVAAIMQQLLPGFDVKTAGFGAGSDLTIAQNGKELKLELKTSSGADFGQFKLRYVLNSDEWEPIRTKKFIENADLYGGIFNQILKPNLEDKIIKNGNFPNYKHRDGAIVGLLRMPGTRNKKLQLQPAWFSGKSDMKLEVAPELVQDYYALKGDSLIQIQGRGVYALTTEMSTYFNVPELKDEIKRSSVRFRIKPHGGSDGNHSFTVALKILLSRSPYSLEDQSFLKKIENYLIN